MNNQRIISGSNYTLINGDSCVETAHIADNSVGLGIHSPPFANLYVYSDSVADMGNCKNGEEFFQHYQYIIKEMHRITIPGRLCAVHCKDLPTYKGRDGAAGLQDFPGDIIRAFCGDEAQELLRARHILERLQLDTSALDQALTQVYAKSATWQYHSRVTIWKDPVIEMERTNNHGLLYKNLCADSSMSRQGMADYLVVFRKWDGIEKTQSVAPVTVGGERFDHYIGLNPPDPRQIAQWYGLQTPRPGKNGKWSTTNPFPVGSEAYRRWSIEVWQRYASPVWFDIDQTNVLNYEVAKEAADDKHLCPLQMDVIERAVHLWSNPGDVVFTPFAGVGSEVYGAVKHGRYGLGVELKESYFNLACRHLAKLEHDMHQPTLFDALAAVAAPAALELAV